MLVVDELLRLEEGEAVSSTLISVGSPFVGADGLADEALLFEMMAQTFAAAMALSPEGQSFTSGYLVGIKRLSIQGRAEAGRAVEVGVRVISQVDDFSVIEGRAEQDGRRLASGQITVYVPREAAR